MPDAARQARPGLAVRMIRAVYQIVILLTSLYFYISIPVLILLVIGLFVGIVQLFFKLGVIPIQIGLALLIATAYTLFAIVRSLFTWVREREPGRRLERSEAPRLWATSQEVAERVGTRPVDVIYINPGVEIAVTERGSLLHRLLGRGKRCLIVGLGVLPGMTMGQFRSILAHEYGHFNNQDTAGGNLARQVQVSMHWMAHGLAVHGQDRLTNPAWLFVNAFYHIFMRITLGASRLQEVLADRHAVAAFGAQDLIAGLKHIIRQSVAFQMELGQQAVVRRKRLEAIYVAPTFESSALTQELDHKVEDIMRRPTSAFDSHPAPQDRIALVEKLNVPSRPDWSGAYAWDVFPNPQAVQDEMTALLQADIDRQGHWDL